MPVFVSTQLSRAREAVDIMLTVWRSGCVA